MTLVYKDDVIAALQDIARVAREKTVARFADVQCDAATRKRLDAEIAAACAQLDAMVERKVGELRGTAGHT
jgi:hypothetical protein